jgi:hypothetical protein
MSWIATPESTSILGYEYVADEQVLIVEYKHGGRYKYYDIPERVAEQMHAASSKGQFIAQNIKGTYRYARA